MTTVEFNPKACEQCRHFACVCAVLAAHDPGCLLRIATACSVPIACDPHGRDVRPTCDPCTCSPRDEELPGMWSNADLSGGAADLGGGS